MATGLSAATYQANVAACSVDNTVWDGSTSTGRDVTGAANTTVGVTAIIDLGSAIAATSLGYNIGYLDNFAWSIDHSNDGTTWTTVTSASGSTFPGSFVQTSGTPAVGGSFRYWRVTVQSAASGGDIPHAAVRELVVNGLIYTPPLPGPYTVTYGLGYQTSGTNSAAGAFSAGNTIANSGPAGGTASVTITIDYGAAKTVSNFAGIIGYANTPSELWETSTDGTTWTTLAATPAATLPAGSGTYLPQFQSWSISGGVTARWFRYSLRDTAPAGVIPQAGIASLAAAGGAGTVPVWCSANVPLTKDSTVVSPPIQVDWGTATDPAVTQTVYQTGGISGWTLASGSGGGIGDITRNQWVSLPIPPYTYVSGGQTVGTTPFVFHGRDEPSNAQPAGVTGLQTYYFSMRWGEYFKNLGAAYLGYFLNPSSPAAASIANGEDYVWAGRFLMYPGYHDSGPAYQVPSLAIGSTWRITACVQTFTYANKRANAFSSTGFSVDMTISTDNYVGFATIGGFTIPQIPAATATAITAQTAIDKLAGLSVPDIGYRATLAPYPRAAWWEVRGGAPGFDYTDALPKGGYPAGRREAWNVTAATQTGMTVYVPVDEQSGAASGIYWVGASIPNFNTNANDIAQNRWYPDSFGNVGVYGCFVVSPAGAFTPPTPPADTSRDHVLLSADAYDGALNVAWVSGGWPGALKHAVHLGPSKHIGSSTVGWQATQTIESGLNTYSVGLVYLVEGQLYLNYNLSGGSRYRINEGRGTGPVSDWSAVSTADADHLSAAGRAQKQVFRFVAGNNTTNSPINFSQCRDAQGKAWTVPVQAASGRGPLVGGAWLKNRYGLLYTDNATGKVFWITADNPASWTATPIDTTKTGNVCGLAVHPSGRLVALTQASTGAAVACIVSNDNGKTWAAGGNPGVSPTPPPVIVVDEDILYCVFIASDAPAYKASLDGGLTWA